VVLVGELLALPLAAWRHVILVRYGLSTQSWSGWAVDVGKGYAVGAVLGAVALVGFYTIARLSPRWWWAWGAVGAATLVVLLRSCFRCSSNRSSTSSPRCRRPVAGGSGGAGAARRRAGPRRAGRRRVAAYQRSERGRVRAQADHRIVVYDAHAGGVTRRGVGGRARARPRQDAGVATGTVLAALVRRRVRAYLLGAWTRCARADSIADPRGIALLWRSQPWRACSRCATEPRLPAHRGRADARSR
jgi:STE24 endopeptidase